MFGLVLRSRLIEAEKRIVDIRLTAIRAENAGKELMQELEVERRLRQAAEAERDRLQAILVAHPIEAAEPDPVKPAKEEAGTMIPRVLSPFEIVTRATAHRNLHKAKDR